MLANCPVDHLAASQCPVDHPPVKEEPKCPVDHATRAAWVLSVQVEIPEAVEVPSEGCDSTKIDNLIGDVTKLNVALPTDREISSIPRTSSGTNWVYPSQKQFYEAMQRKNWNPNADDMKTVVPIHNVVNERTWNHIMMWEKANIENANKKCGGITLTSFKGDSKKLTPRAWFRSTFLGLPKPFDRHDWRINRCGVEVDYVIDFYGNATASGVELDVRPKLNSWEGIKLRLSHALGLD